MKKEVSVYDIITDRIIEKMEQGDIPWVKPWNSRPAVNWVTQKEYRGINQLLLDPGEYLTFNQVKKVRGRVNKGAKSQIVTFYKSLEIEDKDTGEEKTIPMLRYYRVFNIKDCTGIKSKQEEVNFEHNPIEEAEGIIKGYRDRPSITFAPGRAFYRPADDIISIPDKSDFEKVEEYYSTLFHESVHSTGHKSRLNRTGITGIAAFGSEIYSKEELVAEIGAAMLCGIAGIENVTLENSAAYLQSWIRELRNDKRLIVQASSQAQKAADYIQGIVQA